MRRYEVIADYINKNTYQHIAEIGVRNGETTTYLLQHCKSIAQYFLVDPVQDKDLYYFTYKDPVSFIKKRSNEASFYIQDGSLDLVFIDADHSYNAVKEDVELWQPKVRKGGILCGHDYRNAAHRGVEKAVLELFPQEFVNFFPDCYVWAVNV